ncbi:dysbindin-like, partial [Amphiura filiformis]|uniref:dysbindin-like n=1 Tax=Amphiura filiformis TaxID=82378 RepID=UPI003B222C71
FHQTWGDVHRDIEASAEKAVVIDNKVQDVFLNYERRAEPLLQFQRQVQDLPKMVEQIQNITVAISKLEADFEELESMLLGYEDMCDKMELQKNKKTQLEELTKYKEQKRKEEDIQKAHLQEEYNQKFSEIERKEDAKLKERQKAFEDVFSADMDHYRTHGKMERPIAEPVEKSVSSLEEFDLSVDQGDQEALDDFLGTEEDLKDTIDDGEEEEEEQVEEEEETKEVQVEEEETTKEKVTLILPDEDARQVVTGEDEDEVGLPGGERKLSSILSDESSAGDESGIMGVDYVPEITGPIEVQSDAEDIEEEDYATPVASTPVVSSDSDEDDAGGEAGTDDKTGSKIGTNSEDTQT